METTNLQPEYYSAFNQPISGLDYLTVIMNGNIPYPPLLQTLDFKAVNITEGEVVFSFIPQLLHNNSINTVHGGVISAILDTAMGCALHSTLPAGTSYTTIELKTNFLRAVTLKSGELRAIGKIIYLGGQTALTEAQLLDTQNRLFAHGVSTCLIFKI
ncbi:PaaI family thioesterase [Adhaeribacter radiodurans]|uniref:PaaI family thioesterase n=1 Tax=Adhaeribacter radiodurans TaxID=2745197 RepID=A0A7L7LDI3_9BACT|nr:PaaI family thioesterase [Adhaeribacter radiodurans]QMU30898.1 PaaI family thioesterase [Adhaeribacter radiodurans]